MITIEDKKRLEGSIVTISENANYLFIMDNINNFYIFNRYDFELIKKTKLLKTDSCAHRYSKAFSISRSPTKNYINIPIFGKNLSSLIELNSKLKQIKNLNWHTSDIEVSTFCEKSAYLATGGGDGKVFIFNTENGNLVTSLPNKPDYISAISFSKRGELIATASFDNKLILFDITRNILISEFKVNSVIEDIKFFDSDSKLLLGLRDGTILIYDIASCEIISSEIHFSEWISKITLSEDSKFALIATRKEFFYIINIEDNRLLFDIKRDISGISSIELFKDKLFIGFVDGTLEIIDVKNYLYEFEEAIEKKEFKKAKEYMEKNILLNIHPLAEKFYHAWDYLLMEAMELVAQNKVESARELLKPFLGDKERAKKFDFYISKKRVIIAFRRATIEKDLATAYDLVEDNEFLKELQPYKELEEFWFKAFNFAKRLLQEDARLNRTKAIKILKPFTIIPNKKEQVYFLIKNYDKYFHAENFVKKREFKKYFKYIKSFPFLADTDVYKKVLTFGESTLTKITTLEQNGEYQKALKLSESIVDFIPFQKNLSQIVEALKAKIAFVEYVEKDLEFEAYKLIEERVELKLLDAYEKLTNKFKVTLSNASEMAYKGEVLETLNIFGKYMEMDYYRDKIASIIKIAYLNEIKNADIEINFENVFNLYISRFSKDNEIEKLAKELKKVEILDKLEDGDEKGYLNLAYLNTILVS